MAEIIVDQHETETLSTTDHTDEINRIKIIRFSPKHFFVQVSQCMKIANTIRADIRSQIVYITIDKT